MHLEFWQIVNFQPTCLCGLFTNEEKMYKLTKNFSEKLKCIVTVMLYWQCISQNFWQIVSEVHLKFLKFATNLASSLHSCQSKCELQHKVMNFVANFITNFITNLRTSMCWKFQARSIGLNYESFYPTIQGEAVQTAIETIDP